MTQHTPGPWSLSWPDYEEARESYEEFGSSGQHGYALVSGPNGDWSRFAHVAVVVDGEPDDVGEANARLIAAAPELLAACKAALELMPKGEYEKAGPASRAVEIRNLIRASIANAEGTKPTE